MAWRAPIYQHAQEDPNRLPFAALEGFAPRDKQIVELFGDKGPLMAIPGYQPRDAQIDLADAIHKAIKLRRHLVGEAGTGCGKSFGYLVPAILHAVETGTKVVVSTVNLALQDQLRHKDLPTLQRILSLRSGLEVELREIEFELHEIENDSALSSVSDEELNRLAKQASELEEKAHKLRQWIPEQKDTIKRRFRWVAAKGKSNYLCLDKLNDINGFPPFEFEEEDAQIRGWASTTTTGDLSECGVNLKSDRYRELKVLFQIVDRDECAGPKKCDFGAAGFQGDASGCYYYQMKHQAERADVIIVNHHLLILDQIMGGQLLPPYDVVICDEAHQLEDIIRENLQITISHPVLQKLINKARKKLDEGELEHVLTTRENFFRHLDQALRKNLQQGKEKVRVFLSQFNEQVVYWADQLILALEDIPLQLSALDQEALADDFRGFTDALRQLLKTDSTWVMWGELPNTRGSEKLMGLKMQPIDIAPWCKQTMAGKSWIFTSATLATTTSAENQFDYFKKTMGLDSCSEINVGSPYDYTKQAMYYVPMLPLSSQEMLKQGNRTIETVSAFKERWAQTFLPEYEAVLQATEGRALLLFTSRESMVQMGYRLAHLPWPMRQQGDAPNPDLVEWLQSTPHSVLLALASFWEGVNIPGEALSCVVIDKLPFPPPDDPVMDARGEQLGGRFKAFMKLSVPAATIKMKQGIGRLIRLETDRGLVVIMDVRLRHKEYGREMLLSLPGAPNKVGSPFKLISRIDLPRANLFINRGMIKPTDPLEQHAARALVALAELDGDQAAELNGVGFSKADTQIGHSLADQLRTSGRLTRKQWSVAVELAKRYRRQVPIPEEFQEAI